MYHLSAPDPLLCDTGQDPAESSQLVSCWAWPTEGARAMLPDHLQWLEEWVQSGRKGCPFFFPGGCFPCAAVGQHAWGLAALISVVLVNKLQAASSGKFLCHPVGCLFLWGRARPSTKRSETQPGWRRGPSSRYFWVLSLFTHPQPKKEQLFYWSRYFWTS